MTTFTLKLSIAPFRDVLALALEWERVGSLAGDYTFGNSYLEGRNRTRGEDLPSAAAIAAALTGTAPAAVELHWHDHVAGVLTRQSLIDGITRLAEEAPRIFARIVGGEGTSEDGLLLLKYALPPREPSTAALPASNLLPAD